MTSYLQLSGTGYADTPDDNSLDITGDVDIRCAVALDDWTPSNYAVLVRKKDDSGPGPVDNSYQMYVNITDGKLVFDWSTDGTNGGVRGATSSVAPTVTDGSLLLVRATLDVDNGAAGCDIKFYTKASTVETAFADLNSDAGWTQLSTETQAGTTSIHSGSSVLTVGGSSVGTFGVVGAIYGAVVKNGIAGTTVANPDFTAQSAGTTSFADAAGRTWTLHGDATIIVPSGVPPQKQATTRPTLPPSRAASW